VGAVVAVAVLLLGRTGLMRRAELATFDARTRAFADPALASKDIVIAAIDETSLNELAPAVGRWPWPRAVHAQVLDYLRYAGAKLVVYDVQFPEPDQNAGSDEAFASALGESGNAVLPVAFLEGGRDDGAVVGAATGEAALPRFALPVRGGPSSTPRSSPHRSSQPQSPDQFHVKRWPLQGTHPLRKPASSSSRTRRAASGRPRQQ